MAVLAADNITIVEFAVAVVLAPQGVDFVPYAGPVRAVVSQLAVRAWAIAPPHPRQSPEAGVEAPCRCPQVARNRHATPTEVPVQRHAVTLSQHPVGQVLIGLAHVQLPLHASS